MRTIFFFIALFVLSDLTIKAQGKNLNFNIEALGGVISSGRIPFWLRSNQFGSIPLDNASLSLIGSAHKDYDITKNHLVDLGASVEGRVNVGHR